MAKLRWLLGKATLAFGARRLDDMRSQEIAAWRMTIPAGHRVEATQALRQVLARAVQWGLLDRNPARKGSRTQAPRESAPFDSWRRSGPLAALLGPGTDR